MPTSTLVKTQVTEIHDALDTRDFLKLVTGRVSMRQLGLIVQRAVGDFGATVQIHDEAVETIEFPKVEGYFYPDRTKPFAVNLLVPPGRKDFSMTPGQFSDFRFELSETLQHEMIHYGQWMNWQWDTGHHRIPACKQDREEALLYFADKCEVEAYGHDLAMEIRYYYPDVDPEEVIASLPHRSRTYAYIQYKRAFAGLDWDNIRQHLIKHTRKWLRTVQVPERIR